MRSFSIIRLEDVDFKRLTVCLVGLERFPIEVR